MMIDCSHENSGKDYTRQGTVAREIASQVREGDRRILGAMIESNLVAGAQKFAAGGPLVYGQSLTDGCIGWPETVDVLRELAEAVGVARGRERS